jgi:hypothetical protein
MVISSYITICRWDGMGHKLQYGHCAVRVEAKSAVSDTQYRYSTS